VRIASSAPTRIDLAGGTYDIWPLYLFHDRAQTINAAISLRAQCVLTSRDEGGVALRSADTGEHVEAPTPDELPTERLPLVGRLVRHFGAQSVDVWTRSESPVGAGIAGSSAMAITVAGALAAWTDRPLTDEALLALAMNVEAQVLGVPTGLQDFRPALHGGVSAIEMNLRGVQRVRLDLDLDDLSRRVVLAYTGASRQSGINNWDVMTRRINGDPEIVRAFDGIRDAAAALRLALERQDWPAAGRAIADEWDQRKCLAPGVTTPQIDQLLEGAAHAGALGGKVCGAGGGGCLFCLTPPERRDQVAASLARGGATLLPFRFESSGLMLERS